MSYRHPRASWIPAWCWWILWILIGLAVIKTVIVNLKSI